MNTLKTSKFYRVEKGDDRYTVCPVCDRKNDHLTGQCCNHLHKVTKAGVAFYWWGFRPEGWKAEA